LTNPEGRGLLHTQRIRVLTTHNALVQHPSYSGRTVFCTTVDAFACCKLSCLPCSTSAPPSTAEMGHSEWFALLRPPYMMMTRAAARMYTPKVLSESILSSRAHDEAQISVDSRIQDSFGYTKQSRRIESSTVRLCWSTWHRTARSGMARLRNARARRHELSSSDLFASDPLQCNLSRALKPAKVACPTLNQQFLVH
jgi:hypothetical protein